MPTVNLLDAIATATEPGLDVAAALHTLRNADTRTRRRRWMRTAFRGQAVTLAAAADRVSLGRLRYALLDPALADVDRPTLAGWTILVRAADGYGHADATAAAAVAVAAALHPDGDWTWFADAPTAAGIETVLRGDVGHRLPRAHIDAVLSALTQPDPRCGPPAAVGRHGHLTDPRLVLQPPAAGGQQLLF